jgi:hypothetical protein
MFSALKILLLIIAIPTLPLGFIVGIPFLIIGLPSLFGAIAIDRYQAKERSGTVSGSSSNTIWNLVIVVFGIGLFFAISSVGSLGNIDTTGKASSSTIIGALIVSAIVIIGGLTIVNRNKT